MAATAGALVVGVLIGATARRDDGAARTPLTVASAATTPVSLAATSTEATAPPSTRAPGEVRVVVLNGAHQAGVAGALTDELRSRGFAMAPAGDVDPHPQTTVYVASGEDANCEVVRAAVQEVRGEPAVSVPLLDPPQIPGAEGMSCVVVIGRRFA